MGAGALAVERTPGVMQLVLDSAIVLDEYSVHTDKRRAKPASSWVCTINTIGSLFPIQP